MYRGLVAPRGQNGRIVKMTPNNQTCLLCMGNEDVKHILLSCLECNLWIKKWVCRGTRLAYRKIINYTQI